MCTVNGFLCTALYIVLLTEEEVLVIQMFLFSVSHFWTKAREWWWAVRCFISNPRSWLELCKSGNIFVLERQGGWSHTFYWSSFCWWETQPFELTQSSFSGHTFLYDNFHFFIPGHFVNIGFCGILYFLPSDCYCCAVLNLYHIPSQSEGIKDLLLIVVCSVVIAMFVPGY